MKKSLLLAAMGFAMASSLYATDYYIIGSTVNGKEWSLKSDDAKFEETATSGVYTWTGSQLGPEFKINDGTWNNVVNFGSNGSQIEVGQDYSYNKNGGSNIVIKDNGSISNPTVTLNINTGTIKIEGEEAGFTNSFSEVYLVGQINSTSWNQDVTTFPLELKSGTTDTYTGTYQIKKGQNYIKVKAGIIFGTGGEDVAIVPDEAHNITNTGNAFVLDLDADTEYTFTVVLDQDSNNGTLTVSTDETPTEFTKVYFMSDRYHFEANPAFRMTTDNGEVYTLHVPDAGSDVAFKFMAKLPDGDKWFSNGQQNIHNSTFTLTGDNTTNMTFHTGGDVTLTLKPINNFASIEVTIEGQDHDANPYPPIYLVGDMTNWEAEEAYRLQTSDGVNYTLTVPNISGDDSFKFLGDDPHGYLFSNGVQDLKNGEYELSTDADKGNMSLKTGGNVTFTFVLGDMHKTATLTIAGQEEGVEEDEFPEMYIVGEMMGWDAKSKNKMTTTDGLTYTITVPGMTKQDFKFNGGNWQTRVLTGAGGGLANGTYTLTNGNANMSLGIGGDVTLTLVFSKGENEEVDYTTAQLTIAGQVGDVPAPVITYALRGEFFTKDSWDDISLTKADDSDVWTASFTPTYTGGSFGVKRMVNGIQPNVDGWFSAPASFSKTNASVELVGGDNGTFDFPVGTEYTATFNPDTKVLSFTYEGGDDPINPDVIDLYLIGEATSTGWTVGIDDYKMTTTDGKTYTITCKLEGGKGFKVYPGNWDDTAHNFGGAGTDLENNTYDVQKNGGDMTLKYGGDNVTITLVQENNFENVTITIAGQDENIVVEKIITYGVHGQWDGLEGGDWKTIELQKVSDTEWTATYTPQVSGGSFGVKKMENGTQVEWYALNHSFTSTTHTASLILNHGENCTHAYPANTPCKFTFNPETLELSVVGDTSTGIEEIEAASSDAVYFNLQGVRVNNPENGLYIRVREGKSEKVMINK